MAARGHIQSALERRVQEPGMLRHGPFSAGLQPLDPLPHPDLLENKIAAQAAEIEQLAGDNHRLAASHLALREDLIAAQQEAQRLKAHIRSTQTESDIQIRVLLDKIAKMEKDIRVGEKVKDNLKQAHMEAHSLAKSRQVLTTEVQLASQELQKVRADVKSLPDLHSELDSLRRELKRLRATFEYEKGLNIEKVKQLQAIEQNLIGMAREVEKLRAEVSNAEKRARAPNPHGGGYMTPDPPYPSSTQGGGVCIDGDERPLVHMAVGSTGDGVIPCGSSNCVAAGGGVGGVVVPNTGGVAAWGGPNEACIPKGKKK